MTQEQYEKNLKTVALILAKYAVRDNTVLEEYHIAGKLSNPEMMALNKEVVNNLYTFLQILANPKYKEEKKQLVANKDPFYIPRDWDTPVFQEWLVDILRK